MAHEPVVVLLHSPLTGPQAWGELPAALEARERTTVVVDVGDDDRPPYASRYAARAALQVGAGVTHPHQPVVLVAHSGAGPLLPQLGFAQRAARRAVAAYVFCDAGLPHPRAGTRMQLLEAEDGDRARELHAALHAGARFPEWTDADLRDSVPDPSARACLLASLRPRSHDFFTEPLPGVGEWPDAPCAYLRTSPAYDVHARMARKRGWPVAERNAGHFAALVDPQAAAEDLLALIERCS